MGVAMTLHWMNRLEYAPSLGQSMNLETPLRGSLSVKRYQRGICDHGEHNRPICILVMPTASYHEPCLIRSFGVQQIMREMQAASPLTAVVAPLSQPLGAVCIRAVVLQLHAPLWHPVSVRFEVLQVGKYMVDGFVESLIRQSRWHLRLNRLNRLEHASVRSSVSAGYDL